MHAHRTRRVVRILAVVAAVVAASLTTNSVAAAQSPVHFRVPNLVVLGDSYASGVGNTPYLPEIRPTTEDTSCKRSDAAYGELLADVGLVRLQAFVACSGATTAQVSGPGPNGETPPQIDSITRDTDVVTVQALGNDFFFGEISFRCLSDPTNCSWQTHLKNGQTIREVVDSIPVQGGANLKALYGAINQRLKTVGSHARVIATDYPNLFGDGGGACRGFISPTLVDIARQMAGNLGATIKQAAADNGFRYAPVSALFSRHDVCDPVPAIYLPTGKGGLGAPADDPGGALHPNHLGQALYAGAIAARLFF